ncbi:MAG TPA: branched-chain amino acid aminotransferase [Candidatus Deferrimicrobium sp.]
MQISVTQAPENRRRQKPKSSEKLGFGKHFSDHMFLMDYSQGTGWRDARIVPYGPLSLAPSAMVLHYAQEIFEGMKAYYARDGAVCLFRPDRNAERMNRSATRMCLPEIPVEDQLAAIRALVRLDREWIPRGEGASLYIRPTMIGTEEGLGVRPSAEVLFFIITGPVGAYYARGFDPVRILVEEQYVRAAKGGVGEAKTGGNYAASLLSAKNAKALGFDQVLWLDAERRCFVEEVGTMNIFFVLRGELVTPPLSGSILPGVTRDTVLTLAQEWKIPVAERPVEIDEVLKGAADGTLSEAFGSGTAAVISPVGSFSCRRQEVAVNGGKAGELAARFFREITGMQYGEIEDRHRWIHRVE